MDFIELLCGLLLCSSAIYLYYCSKCVKAIPVNTRPPLYHNDILSILSALNYPNFDGVCYGFTLNWALAVAEKKESSFYAQVEIIRELNVELPRALRYLESLHDDGVSLNLKQQSILDVSSLLQRIGKAQDPPLYRHDFGQLLWQPDITAILRKMNPDSININRLFFKTLTFASKKQAIDFFDHLIDFGINETISIVLIAAFHATGLRRIGKEWHFININKLYRQDQNFPYFKFNTIELVNELYSCSTSGPLCRRLNINIHFVGLTFHGSHRLFHSLEHVFPSPTDTLNTTPGKQWPYFTMAAHEGDLDGVKECLKKGLCIFSEDPRYDSLSAVEGAIVGGRREIVQAMMGQIKPQINRKNKKTGTTLLHEACASGHVGIVADLLKINTIAINALDNDGLTPLMEACRSQANKEAPEIFELLLKHNARLDLMDNACKTALDYAREQQNRVAIAILQRHLEEDETYSDCDESQEPPNCVSLLPMFWRTKPSNAQPIRIYSHSRSYSGH